MYLMCSARAGRGSVVSSVWKVEEVEDAGQLTGQLAQTGSSGSATYGILHLTAIEYYVLKSALQTTYEL